MCAPHKTDDEPNMEFQINSGKVFDALALVMRDMVAGTYFKPFAKKYDGRGVSTAITWDQTMSTTRPLLLSMIST
jgi:hypothetical protein